MTSKEILKALSHVEDPDLKKDIVTLGMVKELVFDEKKIAFELELTTPACPMKDVLVRACKNAISMMVDKNIEVEIEVTSRTTSSVLRKGALKGIKNILAVSSGKGGVGKSTVALNLALSLAESGARVGLMDADIYGPSIPTLLNLGNVDIEMETEGEKTIMVPVDCQGLKVFSIGFLVQPDEPLVWRGPMLTAVLRQFANDVKWGELDYLIVDLPPGTGDVQISLAQMLEFTGNVIVTTPQELSTADVRKAISMWQIPSLQIPILGIVENMSFFKSPEGKDYYIFGNGGGEVLQKETNFPLLAKIPIFEPNGAENRSLMTYNPILKEMYNDLTGNLVSAMAILNNENGND